MDSDDPRQGRVIAVVGPTAVGKSALAEGLADALGGQIISADSMQVYRGMDIGTAKTPPSQLKVPHHCIDLVDPGVSFSAALYQRVAREAIDSILEAGDLPVVTGGTGLYVRAALDDWEFPRGESTSATRARLEAEARTIGAAALHERLRGLDPSSAELIHPSNIRRTIRALEMAEEGVRYADQAERFSRRRSIYDTRFVGLTMERERLYARIDDRVDAMIASGLSHEVASLLSRGFRSALTAAQAIGYKEIVPVLEGRADIDDAIADIKQATRRYAKRQMTWFRGDDRIAWVDVTDMGTEDILARVRVLVESDEPPHHAGPPRPGSWRVGSGPDR